MCSSDRDCALIREVLTISSVCSVYRCTILVYHVCVGIGETCLTMCSVCVPFAERTFQMSSPDYTPLFALAGATSAIVFTGECSIQECAYKTEHIKLTNLGNRMFYTIAGC